ncbi:MAG: plasmid mobilization relaxosome protein MobC [Methylobacter sp.]
MAVLKTLVDDDAKAGFRNKAKALRLSESELLRAVILAVIDQNTIPDHPIELDAENAECDRMTIRMPRFLKEAIKERAKPKGMVPSRWVTALIQSNLTGQPVMTDAELIALRTSNRELAALGRNINQIARALNRDSYEKEQIRLDRLADLDAAIDKNKKAVRALIRASQNTWGIN